jgi:hypothetical protein
VRRAAGAESTTAKSRDGVSKTRLRQPVAFQRRCIGLAQRSDIVKLSQKNIGQKVGEKLGFL